jgi:hypothetical protein
MGVDLNWSSYNQHTPLMWKYFTADNPRDHPKTSITLENTAITFI